MLGPLINSGGIIVGGIVGAAAARYIPSRLQKGLPASFALAALAIGVGMIIKVKFLPVVVMSIILGTAVGELCYLEAGVSRGSQWLQKKLDWLLPIPRNLSHQEFSQQFTALIALFGASGLGVIGALTEGLNGDYQLLLVKGMMDMLTSMIFAMVLGPAVAMLFIVQLAVQVILFYLAQIIMPYMDALAYADFTAVGGIIMLAIGLRMAKIMNFAVVNFLPALILVIPFSYLWRHFFS